MKLANTLQLQHALKEWAIAIEALTTGKTIILLRKGGISERDFQIKHSPAWLYPTYEHQKPHLLKSIYGSEVTAVKSGWHPHEVKISGCGEITDVLSVSNIDQLKALYPYHIWNEQMVVDRFKWKPQKPLIVLLVRAYRLSSPQLIPYQDSYGGCKSWIDLAQSISTASLVPVITEEEYSRQIELIKKNFETN